MGPIDFRFMTVVCFCFAYFSLASADNDLMNGGFDDGPPISSYWSVGDSLTATLDNNAADYHSAPYCVSLQFKSPFPGGNDQPYRLSQQFAPNPVIRLN